VFDAIIMKCDAAPCRSALDAKANKVTQVWKVIQVIDGDGHPRVELHTLIVYPELRAFNGMTTRETMKRQEFIRAQSEIDVSEFHVCDLSEDGKSSCHVNRVIDTLRWALGCFNIQGLRVNVETTAISPNDCIVKGDPLAWTAYWCALSLYGPKNLHPQALHLAARFIRGDDMEKRVIASTVLAWRGLPMPPSTYSPYFQAVRDLAWIATSLDFWPALADVASLMLPQLHDDKLVALMSRDKEWSERNILALNARLDLDIGKPPRREAPIHRVTEVGSPLVNNSEAAMLAVMFSMMEGTQSRVFEFDARETAFPIINGRSDVWFVLFEE
jgi:hypothetical protein